MAVSKSLVVPRYDCVFFLALEKHPSQYVQLIYAQLLSLAFKRNQGWKKLIKIKKVDAINEKR